MVVKEWRRYGNDRLYVNDVETDLKVAVFDRLTGKLDLIDESREAEVVRALRPFLAGALPLSTAEQLFAEATPEKDLTENRPGAAVAARAREVGPQGFQRIVARLLRLPNEATSWEIGARGERIVGGRLDKLRRDGWGVLPSVQLRSGSDIDHVVIGPPGVFTINTKHHKDAHIKVGNHVVWVNGFKQPYLRNSRHEATSAAR
ncbi:MAG: nuclease-related domain-containing protein, partial [Trebonia sp.]